MTYFIFFYFS